MKNNKLLISILSVFVLLFVSCKDSLIHDFNEQKETATLSFSVNGSSSRNINRKDTLEWFDSGTLNASIVDPHYVIDKSTTGETVRVNEGGIWLIQSTATYADFT